MIEQLHASAGSGKTYRLTRRFLHLLMQSGAPSAACGPVPGDEYGPDSILAITFTNKAAAEMKDRVLTALKSLALGQPDAEFAAPGDRGKAARWLERTLRHYQTLNIRTIDSLLNLLARLFALELGLPPDFVTSLDENAVFEDLHDAVMSGATIPQAELDALITRMADALLVIEGASGFFLAERVEERLREVFREYLTRQAPAACDSRELHRELETLRAGLAMAAGAMKAALSGAGAAPSSNFANFLDNLESIASLKAVPTSAFASKESIADCLLKDSRHLASPSLEDLYAGLKQCHALAVTRGKALTSALAWQPFLEFSRHIHDAFEAYRREKALALLSQLPPGVAELLSESGGVPEAYCRLGSRLNHLLIDEFQDTSVSQWQVLSQLAQECLSKGGSLFYVGDVKQAIYGWRGGEAGLFEAAAREPELARLAQSHRETLDRNWRSAPEIVRFNNTVFSGLADPKTARLVAMSLLSGAPETVVEALAAELAAGYADAAQMTPPGREASGGYVTLTRLPGDKDSEHKDAARRALADLFTTDLLKRRDPSDIAVLTRTNAEAALAAQWLVDMDIPVVTENSLRLADHPIVRGAVSFLAFLDYPPDNLALWGFLSCRELFGRSQDIPRQRLSDWLAAQPKGPLHRTFRLDFPDAWARLMEPFLKGAGPAGPYDLIQELFAACGVFEAYPGDEVFLRRFLELIHNAETQGHGSLSSFLEFWNEKGREEKIPQPEDARAVRVLTVHKAKGLEFPVVVVPFHDIPFRMRDQLVETNIDGLAFTAPLSRDNGGEYHRQASKTLLELVNLLYVAWTRPEEELHLFLPGSEKMVNAHPVLKAAGIMLQAVGFGLSDTRAVFGAKPPSQAELVAMPEAAPPQEPPAPGSPLTASAPLSWLPGLKIMRRELADPGDRQGTAQRRRGVALHRALELLRPHSDPLQTVLKAMALEGIEDEDMALDLATGLEWLLGQEDFTLCRENGLREAELMDADGSLHRPDLLAFTGREVLILDYKSGREDDAHHEQVRRYMRLAASLPLAEGLPVRGLLAYVDLHVMREVAAGGAA